MSEDTINRLPVKRILMFDSSNSSPSASQSFTNQRILQDSQTTNTPSVFGSPQASDIMSQPDKDESTLQIDTSKLNTDIEELKNRLNGILHRKNENEDEENTPISSNFSNEKQFPNLQLAKELPDTNSKLVAGLTHITNFNDHSLSKPIAEATSGRLELFNTLFSQIPPHKSELPEGRSDIGTRLTPDVSSFKDNLSIDSLASFSENYSLSSLVIAKEPVSENPELASLKEILSKEQLKRKHCEQQILDLQAQILDREQQLAISKATELSKTSMVNQLDQAFNKIVNDWKTSDREQKDRLKQLQSDNERCVYTNIKQQEVINTFEKDLTNAVHELEIAQSKVSSLESQLQHRTQNFTNELMTLQNLRDKQEASIATLRSEKQDALSSKNKIFQEKEKLYRESIDQKKGLESNVEKLQNEIASEKRMREAESRRCRDLKKELVNMQKLFEQGNAANRVAAESHVNAMNAVKSEAANECLKFKEEAERQVQQMKERHTAEVIDLKERYQTELDLKDQEKERLVSEMKLQLRTIQQEHNLKIDQLLTEISNIKHESLEAESKHAQLVNKFQQLLRNQYSQACNLLEDKKLNLSLNMNGNDLYVQSSHAEMDSSPSDSTPSTVIDTHPHPVLDPSSCYHLQKRDLQSDASFLSTHTETPRKVSFSLSQPPRSSSSFVVSQSPLKANFSMKQPLVDLTSDNIYHSEESASNSSFLKAILNSAHDSNIEDTEINDEESVSRDSAVHSSAWTPPIKQSKENDIPDASFDKKNIELQKYIQMLLKRPIGELISEDSEEKVAADNHEPQPLAISLNSQTSAPGKMTKQRKVASIHRSKGVIYGSNPSTARSTPKRADNTPWK